MNKKSNIKKTLASVTIIGLILTTGAVNVQATNQSTRIYGKGRVQTAVKIAEASFTTTWKNNKVVILAPASDKNLIDALAVSPLAYKLNAPILLNEEKDSISKDNLEILKSQGIKTVYISTGAGVISEKVETELKNMGITIHRLGGKDRFQTAKNIYDSFIQNGGNTDSIALVAPGALPDALSVASTAASGGMPIFLTNMEGTSVCENLSNDATKAKSVYAIGGKSVIKDSLVQKLKALRLGGTNRFETNAQVINKFNSEGKLNFNKVYLANGIDNHLVDALTGSVLAAQYKSPVVLVSSTLDPTLKGILKGKVTDQTSIISFGGTTVLTDTVLQKVMDVNKVEELRIDSVE